MPHIVVEEFTPPKLPCKKDEFEYQFKTEGDEGLIAVSSENYKFLLEYFPHKRGVIIKPDKITRIPNISKLKKSLQTLIDIVQPNVVHSNIDGRIIEREYDNLISRDNLLEKLENSKDIWFEIGFGSGRLIQYHATENPDITHLGVEIHKPSIEQLLKQCEIEKINNILVVSDDARIILETLKPNSVSRVLVHFPVPWDDSPEKRIFSETFVNEAIKVLKPNGTLELRTDSPNYYNFVTDLYKSMKLDVNIKKNEEIQVISKYETRWRKQEKDIYDVVYTNIENTKEEKEEINFDFEKYSDIFQKITKLSDKAVVKEGFLLKINKTYKINKDEFMVKLVMGRHSFPQAIYLKVDGKSLDYYPKKPYFTKENYLAHCEIKRVLEEK